MEEKQTATPPCSLQRAPRRVLAEGRLAHCAPRATSARETDGTALPRLQLCVKTQTGLAPLHSTPVRFYTKAARVQILTVINVCGLLVLTRSLRGVGRSVRGTAVLRLGTPARPLAVCGDVGGGAAVAVRGLRPLDVQVQ